MNQAAAPTPGTTRLERERDLPRELLERQSQWLNAGEAHREIARLRFMDALHAFEEMILRDETPLAG